MSPRERYPSFANLKPTSTTASTVGRSNHPKDTKPELLLRRTLWRKGHRYRLHCKDLPGRPDLVFRKRKLVVFCDGDFWHGRDWGSRRERLKRGANAEYWVAKIGRNIERDERVTRALRSDGWTVIRVWEGDVNDDPESVAGFISTVLKNETSVPAVG